MQVELRELQPQLIVASQEVDANTVIVEKESIEVAKVEKVSDDDDLHPCFFFILKKYVWNEKLTIIFTAPIETKQNIKHMRSSKHPTRILLNRTDHFWQTKNFVKDVDDDDDVCHIYFLPTNI